MSATTTTVDELLAITLDKAREEGDWRAMFIEKLANHNPRPKKAIHYGMKAQPWTGGFFESAHCGSYGRAGALIITNDPALVTCKRCMRYLP